MNSKRIIESSTLQAHKRQFAWQILVPVLVVTVVIIAAAVLIATSSGAVDQNWADISTIWLIAPWLVFSVVFLVILGFLIYGIAKLLRFTPRYTGKAQEIFSVASRWSKKIADGAAAPVIWVQQAGAILKTIFKL